MLLSDETVGVTKLEAVSDSERDAESVTDVSVGKVNDAEVCAVDSVAEPVSSLDVDTRDWPSAEESETETEDADSPEIEDNVVGVIEENSELKEPEVGSDTELVEAESVVNADEVRSDAEIDDSVEKALDVEVPSLVVMNEASSTDVDPNEDVGSDVKALLLVALAGSEDVAKLVKLSLAEPVLSEDAESVLAVDWKTSLKVSVVLALFVSLALTLLNELESEKAEDRVDAESVVILSESVLAVTMTDSEDEGLLNTFDKAVSVSEAEAEAVLPEIVASLLREAELALLASVDALKDAEASVAELLVAGSELAVDNVSDAKSGSVELRAEEALGETVLSDAVSVGWEPLIAVVRTVVETEVTPSDVMREVKVVEINEAPSASELEVKPD
ncbi:hypothetical protein K4K58_013241 [Colletotrichum sp. SAR11_239]|nr:hypothetical protein K4K58_013241 [Colletotrichum sp. SAR11_239]